jgi:hypothetical protein
VSISKSHNLKYLVHHIMKHFVEVGVYMPSFDHGVRDLTKKDNYVTPLYEFITYLHLLLKKKT